LAQPLSQDREPLSISIRHNGQIYLQNTQIAEDSLVPRLKAIASNGYDQRIFVRADQSIEYGRVMTIMGQLNAAGFTHIGLVTDAPKPDRKNTD